MNLGLEGKSVLVTGASRGLGFASAQLFAEEGAAVTIASRSEDALQTAAEKIQDATGKKVNIVRMDVNRPEDVNRAVAQAEEFGNGLDVLVCNAGGPPSGAFVDLEEKNWYQAFEQNLLSVVRLTKAAIPHLSRSDAGRIITLTSSSIKQPISGLVLSNTMRAGVWGLTKTLSQELAESGILVNTVAPGRIATDRVEQLDSGAAEKRGVSLEQVQEEVAAQIPLGRYGDPEEFARAVVFLASPANSYITGQALIVDGGMLKSL